MPDTKFSFANLREHLRKYFWIYLIGIVICLFGSNLLWTMTRPQIPDDQSVIIYMVDSYSSSEPLDAIAQDMLQRTQAFDESLLAVEFQSLQYTDPDVDYTGTMVLMTRLAVGEGDAFMANADAMEMLVNSGVLLPLDDYVADGWLAQYNLEPYYATVTDEDSGESTTYLAGLSLDGVDALLNMSAFNNRGAYLAVAINGNNIETSMKAVEYMMEDLTKEAADADAEGAEPAA